MSGGRAGRLEQARLCEVTGLPSLPAARPCFLRACAVAEVVAHAGMCGPSGTSAMASTPWSPTWTFRRSWRRRQVRPVQLQRPLRPCLCSAYGLHIAEASARLTVLTPRSGTACAAGVPLMRCSRRREGCAADVRDWRHAAAIHLLRNRHASPAPWVGTPVHIILVAGWRAGRFAGTRLHPRKSETRGPAGQGGCRVRCWPRKLR